MLSKRKQFYVAGSITELKVNKIEIIDKSHLHSGHKSFDDKKYYLKIIIQSEYLKSLSKINAHQKVMKVLENEMKNKIHALEIKIS